MKDSTRRNKISEPGDPAVVTTLSINKIFSTVAHVPDQPATVVISNISPCLEGGAHPVKRTVGDDLVVEADVFKDGHDVLTALLEWRSEGDPSWSETPLRPLINDRWTATFPLTKQGWCEYRITAWGDIFLSWRHEILTKWKAGVEDLSSEILEGAAITSAASQRASGDDARFLAEISSLLKETEAPALPDVLSDPALLALMDIYADRTLATSSASLCVWVDRRRAACSAWYEFFPRSAAGSSEKGSTFRECLPRIDDARAMGFDVIYFPPVHPIGLTKRKGRNNSLVCEPGDPGVPYAIGNFRQGVNGGGHKDVAPELGTLEDFAWLVGEIHNRGMEVALDFAINCSPDHPYVTEHPEWFFKRPDGSIKYAENPPKKYEDVYPLNFHNPNWQALWQELQDVILFWCRLGVRIFRVDNPHTKPVAFWEWAIAGARSEFPDVIFLSEAFTRPKMMQTLAKVGFTQSYTYFTWRNSKYELTEYLTELTATEMKDYFRPHFFTNTPDILPEFLQKGGRPAFMIRAVLAATLSPLYGIYSGFELCENTPIPGREEYLDSEKYHFQGRDWDAPGNIKDLITRLNGIRSENRALHALANLRFLNAENENLLFYAKASAGADNILFVAVNLDPFQQQSGFVTIPLKDFGVAEGDPYMLDDLLTGESYRWVGPRNYIALIPDARPAHIFRLRRRVGSSLGQDIFA
jgi:starch synthase (maltosyl-transferring)